MYCNRFEDHLSAHLPSPTGSLVMNFERFLVPPSQSLEHAVHAVQSLSSQSFSHDWALQATVCEDSPHGLPPCFIALLTSRKRCDTPPPHSALHLLHPFQAPNLQSTGHGCWLQLFTASSGKHPAPPLGCVMTLRVNFCEPPPQEEEHSSGSHFE